MHSKFQSISELPLSNFSGCYLNAQDVCKNSIYVALQGSKTHGAEFIPQALANGAALILMDKEDTYQPLFSKKYNIYKYPDLKTNLPNIAKEVYKNRSRELIGITGTNGKTTVAYLIYKALSKLNKSTLYIGTLGALSENKKIKTSNTTPDIFTIYKLLEDSKVAYGVLEVSSHGIDQNRIGGLSFSIKVLTNITYDHIDYHGSIENYQNTKLRFIKEDDASKVIISYDDLNEYQVSKKEVFSIAVNKEADLSATIISSNLEGIQLSISFRGIQYFMTSQLVGSLNVPNLLNALAAIILLGIDIKDAIDALESISNIPGRMSIFKTKNSKTVIVDYAHTPDAMEKVLSDIAKMTKKNITTIFGCGGNRDHAKRPMMGSIASKYSKKIILTSDNPRDENPEKIALDIASSIDQSKYQIHLDREEAILREIEAEDDSIILVLGKGHEAQQISDGISISLSDLEIVSRQC